MLASVSWFFPRAHWPRLIAHIPAPVTLLSLVRTFSPSLDGFLWGHHRGCDSDPSRPLTFFFFFHFKKRLCAEWFTHLILKSWQSTAQQVSSFPSSRPAPARNPIRHVRSGVGHHPQRTPLSHIMTCSHIAQVRTSASPVFSCVTSGEFPKCSASVSLHVKWG